jgi:hypothetical protein
MGTRVSGPTLSKTASNRRNPRSAAGLHQQLWRVNRAKGQNDVTCSIGTNSLSLVPEFNACRAAPMEQDSRRQCTGQYGDVRLRREGYR